MLKAPTGPPALPVVGSLPYFGIGQLNQQVAPPPHRQLAALAATHGNVMNVNFGSKPWTVLSSPEAVHEAFVVKGSTFAGRPMVQSMSLSAGQGRAGFARERPDAGLKKLRRAAFGELFSDAAVRAKQGLFAEEAELLCEHLCASPSTELRSSLRHCIANMVLRYAFSSRVGYATEPTGTDAAEEPPEVAELLRLTTAIWAELSATRTSLLDLVGTPADSVAYQPLRELVDARDGLLRKMIRERRDQLQRRDEAAVGVAGAAARPTEDMLDVLLRSGLPEADVLYTLVDLFVAGINTVSTTLEWQLLLTAEFPLVQARARAELDRAVARARGPIGSASEVPLPPYLTALTNEVLRIKPPLLVPRMALADSSVMGYRVPKGQIVYANSWALTHSEAHWREPHAFRPERWLEEEADGSNAGGSRGGAAGAGGAASAAAAACKFIPYSIGRRACPGARLAQAEMEAVSGALFRRLRWARDGEAIDLSEAYGLTLSPAKVQRLRFSRVDAPRPAAVAQERVRRRSGTPRMLASGASPDGHPSDGGRAAEDGAAASSRRAARSARATRRQKMDAEEAAATAADRFREAGTDRRGGWRASKAKGNRRNRRYENRLLQGVADTWTDSSGGGGADIDLDDF